MVTDSQQRFYSPHTLSTGFQAFHAVPRTGGGRKVLLAYHYNESEALWGPSFMQKGGACSLDFPPQASLPGLILCPSTKSGPETSVRVFFPADAFPAESSFLLLSPHIPAHPLSLALASEGLLGTCRLTDSFQRMLWTFQPAF